MPTTITTKQWRVVVGCDGAGVTYKDTIKADLKKDPRVSTFLDVGVNGDDEHTAVPPRRRRRCQEGR